jgi:Flp pilus assembly protein TadG
VSGAARRQSGFIAAEFALGVCVVVLPVALLVLALPTWSERQSMAQRAANESAREVVLAGSLSAGTAAARAVVAQVAGNYGVPPDQVRGPDVSAGGGLAAGQTVVARVTVRMPALVIPLVGQVGGWSGTAVHAERVDDYRSFPQGP